ncbi:MAG: hypothetical protein ACTSSQ_04585, partial [Alphaproteobacteria bacterium]
MVRQIAIADPRLSQLAGDEVALVAAGTMKAQSGVKIEQSRFDMAGLAAQFAGIINSFGADGTFQISANDLAGLAPLAGRDLGGALALSATGSVQFAGGQFDVALDGQSQDARVGIAAADKLLAGRVTFNGGARRKADSVSFDSITVSGSGFAAALDGSFAKDANITASGTITDIGQLSEDSSGPVAFSARVTGPSATPNIDFELTSDRATLSGKPVSDLRLAFSGQVAGEGSSGVAKLQASVDGVPVTGGATLHNGAGGERRIEGLVLRTGKNAITGDLTLDAQSRIAGELAIDAPDLATLAPLVLARASGALKGVIQLSSEGGRQSA